MTAPLFRYLSEPEITAMLTRARKDGRAAAVSLGVAAGIVLCLGVVMIVGYGLDVYRVTTFERQHQEAVAAVALDLAECREANLQYAALAAEAAGIEVGR